MIQVRYKFDINDIGFLDYGMLIFASEADAIALDHTNAIQIHSLIADGDGYYYGYTDGIAAKEMGDDQFVVGYAVLEDGTTVYTKMVQYSPEEYAKRMIEKDSTSDATKALCKALMAYGAAAQNYIGYKTDDLMNEGFEAVSFDESVLGESVFSVDTNETNGFTTKSANIVFDGAVTYRIKYAVSSELSDKTLYAEYTVLGTTMSVEMVKEGNNCYAYINGIAVKDMDEAIKIKPYYVDENGVNVYGTELVYSGYEYARRTLTSSNEAAVELAKAFAMYIYAADAAIK